MRSLFHGAQDPARFLDLRAALGTIANMGLQGSDPEAHLVIYEEIDFVWK